MENTTINNDDVIEVITELTASDIQILKQIVDNCLNISLFTEDNKPVLQSLSGKLEKLSTDLTAAK